MSTPVSEKVLVVVVNVAGVDDDVGDDVEVAV